MAAPRGRRRRPARRRTSSSSGTSMSSTPATARAALGEHAVERRGLVERAREAVEHEARGGVRLRDALGEHADRDVVGHERAAVQVARAPRAPSGVPSAHVLAEHVARGDVRHAAGSGHGGRLGALPCTGRAEQEHGRASRPTSSGRPRSGASSAATPSAASRRAPRPPRSGPTCRRVRCAVACENPP